MKATQKINNFISISLFSISIALFLYAWFVKYPPVKDVDMFKVTKETYQTRTYFKARDKNIKLEITPSLLSRKIFKITLYNISPHYFIMTFDDNLLGLVSIDRLVGFLSQDIDESRYITQSMWNYIKIAELSRIGPLPPIKFESTHFGLKVNGVLNTDIHDNAFKFLKRCIDSQTYLYTEEPKEKEREIEL
ncbi:hypothetical protein EDEG_02452 [Edhazardia aedis USNM 41457]|uniref:Uncharacterized protein n=1 Tax=Edhazardia aedis (strain USNM 41457) TaxID=1003232 RepID=J9D6Q4_EDHAE|nr:hypothetical protein EDEG_02452 [Edhazardia aedis USNM 41457]|eukprot:EJW03199.1 hypothetical protein EDEG_02452 [Edhazardia aedis USNM 41457]